MRLIDANRLRDDFLGMPNCYNGFSDSYDKAMIVDMVDEQPTIDAVPVVRCGNCAKRGKNGKGIPGGCPFGMTDDTCDPNAYCSYGVLSMKVEQRWTEKGKSRK